MRFEDMTPYSLAELDELEFEAAEAIIADKLEDPERYVRDRARWLEDALNVVTMRFGTYELDYVRAMDDCPYDHAHTKHWCGHMFCRWE